MMGEPNNVHTISIHNIDVVVAYVQGLKGDLSTIWRPRGVSTFGKFDEIGTISVRAVDCPVTIKD